MTLALYLLSLLYAADVDALGSRDFHARHAAHVRLEAAGLCAVPALYSGLDGTNSERQWRCELLIEKAGWHYEWCVGLVTRLVMTRDWKTHGLHGDPELGQKPNPELKRIADDERFCTAVFECAATVWRVPLGVDYRNLTAEYRYWLLWDLCRNNNFRLNVPQLMERP